MKVVGLFSGIGGIELGLKKAGHECLLLCENDEQAKAVLKARFPEVPLHSDVRSLDELPEGTELVTAGFPCQDLSQAGRTNGINGEQSSLVEHLFRLLSVPEEDRVPWVLIENVPFMLRLNRGAAMEYLVGRLEALKYRWAYRIIDSRAFGLPQRRRRVYLLASNVGQPESVLLSHDIGPPPNPDHEGRACGFYWTEGNTGLGWAVDAIPPLKGGSGLGIPSAPAIWMPSGAIVTPDIRDAERFQGFDIDWTRPAEKKGRATYRWKLVGNAVSVPVANWIGEKLTNGCASQSLPEAAWTESRSWPSAGYGSRSGHFAVNATTWPAIISHRPLVEFLSFTPKPLSERATAGFYGRLRDSSLNYPPAFGRALQAHLQSQATRAGES